VLRLAGSMAQDTDRVRREVLILVALVLAVDGLFIAGYFVGGLTLAAAPVKLGFTALWTLVTLAIVLRGLTRIRGLRAGPRL
jgi:hypothetical protein